VELGSASSEIDMLNAGHPPSITMWKGQTAHTAKGDRALGISENSSYSVKKVPLRQGEYLIIYSDGLTEAQNTQGDFFGLQRLMKLVSSSSATTSEALGSEILDRVEQFVDEAPRHDDLSLVILRRL
jgi:serine phosphatase RsbU (regulator of sigma subunit)